MSMKTEEIFDLNKNKNKKFLLLFTRLFDFQKKKLLFSSNFSNIIIVIKSVKKLIFCLIFIYIHQIVSKCIYVCVCLCGARASTYLFIGISVGVFDV